MNEKLKNLTTAVRLLIVGILIFSIAYPTIVGIAGQIWSNSAKGSMIQPENEIVGSKLIGQDFDNPKFFHCRPSSIDYNAMKSGSKNLSPRNPELVQRVELFLENISVSSENMRVPSVLVTESGSALDPHITVEAAMFQIPRISRNTGISEDELESLVKEYTKEPLLGVYGLRRVNVLQLNIELKKLIGE